jgi:hypothetical protein
MLKDSSLVVAVRLGPKINFGACLWVLIRPRHIAVCWFHPAFYLGRIFCLETPKASSGPTNWWTVSSLKSWMAILFPHALESHRIPSGNVMQCLLALLYQWGHCFSNLKGFQSCLTIRVNTNVFLWFNICTNFIGTVQDGIYLDLENCSMFS